MTLLSPSAEVLLFNCAVYGWVDQCSLMDPAVQPVLRELADAGLVEWERGVTRRLVLTLAGREYLTAVDGVIQRGEPCPRNQP